MNNEELLEYCLSKPGAEQCDHEQWQTNQIKVADVMFAMVGDIGGRPSISLKTSPEQAESLRQQHLDIVPSEHLNKAHWNTVFLDGVLPNSQFYSLIDRSYQLALQRLPEQRRQALAV